MKKEITILAVLSLLLLSACTQQASAPATSAPGAPEGSIVKVSIKNFAFSPADITVKAGDTVEWTNEDSSSHTVQSTDRTVQSQELFPGDKFSYKFNKKGNYNYICSIHPSMHGSVKVE